MTEPITVRVSADRRVYQQLGGLFGELWHGTADPYTRTLDELEAECGPTREAVIVDPAMLTAAGGEPTEVERLTPDEWQSAANAIRAYIRLCGHRIPDDHPYHAIAAKLADIAGGAA